MKQIGLLWKRIPRGIRSALYILLSVAAVLAIYTFLGAPVLDVEQEFRRAEQAHMVGPGEILGIVDLEEDLGSYRKMLLAETEEGVIMYCYDHAEYEDPELVYREKTGDITLLCAPYPNENREQQTTAFLPVMIFDSYPEAVRAELDITLSISYRGQAYEQTYRLDSVRENAGYFLFHITARNAWGIGIQGTALQRFAMISGYNSGTYSELSFPAEVRLYDAEGDLILRTETRVQSIPAMTRQRIEEPQS